MLAALGVEKFLLGIHQALSGEAKPTNQGAAQNLECRIPVK